MNFNQELITHICNDVNSSEKIKLRKEDYDRFLLLQGKSKEVIANAIKSEFKKQETINELLNRVVPLNITEKVIKKLAGVYVEDPIRVDRNQDEVNNTLIEDLEIEMNMNIRCKEGNQYFKLYKRNLEELFLGENGQPQMRNLPRHTYEVYSFNKKQPDIVDVVVKILENHQDLKKQKLAIWSKDNHIVCNGAGEIMTEQMLNMKNPEGLNPYKVMPFVYNNSVSYSVNPLSDDDLISFAILIPLLLTDLLFATKYQSWAILYTVGFDGEIPFNPNSVINVDYLPNGLAPEIKSIKPEIDSDKIIAIVENLISYLLSTKNLSTSSIIGKTSDVISGVSKMLDSAESVEDKKDQQAYFTKAEKERFHILSKYLFPYWKQNNLLNEQYNDLDFTDDFQLNIIFTNPKPFINDSDKIKLAKERLHLRLSTIKRELKYIYPYMSEDELFSLYNEIIKERNLLNGKLQPDNKSKLDEIV